jgi:hypothetical protein
MSYNIAAIRDLLNAIFDDEQLEIFCYDYFRPVHDAFAHGMTRIWKIHLLIKYCETYDQINGLLNLLQEINPAQYEKYVTAINKPIASPIISPATPKTLVEITTSIDLSDLKSDILFIAVTGFVSALAYVLKIPEKQVRTLKTHHSHGSCQHIDDSLRE